MGVMTHQTIDQAVLGFGCNKTILEAVPERVDSMVLRWTQSVFEQKLVGSRGERRGIITIPREALWLRFQGRQRSTNERNFPQTVVSLVVDHQGARSRAGS
jgi:hypothetical protein